MSEDIDLEEIEIDQVGVMGPIHVFVGCMLVSLEIASCSQSLIEQGYCNLLPESNWPDVIVCCLFLFLERLWVTFWCSWMIWCVEVRRFESSSK